MAYPLLIRKPRSAPQVRCLPNAAMSMPTTPMQWSSAKSLVTTYMGMGVAIPHGTSEKKSTVKKSGVVMLQYPDGVDFGDEKAYLISALPVSVTHTLTCSPMSARSSRTREALEMMKKTPDIKFVLTHLQ